MVTLSDYFSCDFKTASEYIQKTATFRLPGELLCFPVSKVSGSHGRPITHKRFSSSVAAFLYSRKGNRPFLPPSLSANPQKQPRKGNLLYSRKEDESREEQEEKRKQRGATGVQANRRERTAGPDEGARCCVRVGSCGRAAERRVSDEC